LPLKIDRNPASSLGWSAAFAEEYTAAAARGIAMTANGTIAIRAVFMEYLCGSWCGSRSDRD